jgi:hypothetical protein
MRTQPLVLTLLAAAVLAVNLPAVSSDATTVPSGHGLLGGRLVRSGVQRSYNWSGYVRQGSGLTSASASWTVPTVTTTYNGYSSTWVGIDGMTDGYLIQTGTEQDVVNNQPRYDAWYEVISPHRVAPEVVFTGLAIRPGDAITASVVKVSSGSWTMSLRDNTTGASASHTAKFNGPGTSAEWIQEDTDVNGYISAAPDWQSVTFTGATVNGANPNLQYSESMDIYDGNGTQEDDTGSPAGGNGFTVQWLAPGTPTRYA